MNRFLDTCVVVAYCFPTHKFNKRCTEIEEIPQIWASDGVLREWRRTERYIIFEHNSAILEHIQYIKLNFNGNIGIEMKNQLISHSPDDIYKFMELFYNRQSYPIHADKLCDTLDKLMLGLRRKTKERFNNLKKICEIHSRERDYPNKETELAEYAHEEDIFILVDAHDLGLKIKPQPLTFLTTDNKLYDNRQEIVRLIEVNRIKDLKSESALG